MKYLLPLLLLTSCAREWQEAEMMFKSHPQADRILEEAIEEGIKYYTGIDIDLTPSSPEK